jgi:virginiamycin B lyase
MEMPKSKHVLAAMWFTEYAGNRIGSIAPDQTITETLVPTSGSAPYDITVGPDDALWFTENVGNKIGRLR